MSASPSYRRLSCCAAAALLAAGFALSGCASMSETIAPAFADPARYELYDCKQLEGERKALARQRKRAAEMIDAALLPCSPLHPPDAGLTCPAILLQRRGDADCGLGGLEAQLSGEHGCILDRHAGPLRRERQHPMHGVT